jgi:mRNA interferase MazF
VKRGDIITVAIKGDDDKPRPALVIQSDFLSGTDSVLVCLLTTTQRDAPLCRLSLPAGAATGLHQDSQVMVDEIRAVRRNRCGAPVGRIDAGDAAGAGAAARLRRRHRGLKRDRG